MSTTSYTSQMTTKLPDNWIGVWKDWKDICGSIGDAFVEITPDELATHALVIGATGSGKTNLLHHLIAADLMRGHSLIVLDARGDLAQATIELAARVGIDPDLAKFFDLREKHNPLGFDPSKGSGEPSYSALALYDAVAAESESWGVQLAETFRNAVLLLAETGSPITFLDALFHRADIRRNLIARTSSDQLHSFWTRYDSLSPDKQASLASPVLNKISGLLATEGLRRMFGHPSPVDLARQLRTPGSVTLISLAVDELHSAGWMVGQIMLSSICREIFSQANVPESHRVPVRLYVDEFENFNTQHFESILAEGRRFKFSVVLAHQTLAQLSPKIRSLILGNVGVKVIFRTGHQDAEVLNRDLTGVRGAFNFPSLPLGDAVLWRRGDNAWPVEVNAPLIDDVGCASPSSRKFLAQLNELKPAYPDPVDEPQSVDAENEAGTKDPSRKNRLLVRGCSHGGNLEDWLK